MQTRALLAASKRRYFFGLLIIVAGALVIAAYSESTFGGIGALILAAVVVLTLKLTSELNSMLSGLEQRASREEQTTAERLLNLETNSYSHDGFDEAVLGRLRAIEFRLRTLEGSPEESVISQDENGEASHGDF